MSDEYKGAPSDDGQRERKIIEENGQRVALLAAHEVACAHIRLIGEKQQKVMQECQKEMRESLDMVAKMDGMDQAAGWQLNPQMGYWFKLLPSAPAMGPDGVVKDAEVVGSIGPSAGAPNADAGEMAAEQAGAEKENAP